MLPDRKTMQLLGGAFLLMSCTESEPQMSPELRAWNDDHITKGRALFACFHSEYDKSEDNVSPPRIIAQAMYDACDKERAALRETYLTFPKVETISRQEIMHKEDVLQIGNALGIVERKRDGTFIEGIER